MLIYILQWNVTKKCAKTMQLKKIIVLENANYWTEIDT